MGEVSEETLLTEIISSLSPKRQANFSNVKDMPEKVKRPYLNRFSPVYFTRKMKSLNSQGARIAAWFAGAKTVRRIADGNPRRFFQLMNELVEKARQDSLTPRNQHRILTSFCKRYFEDLAGYPDYGPFLSILIEKLGGLLSERVHGKWMVDGGSAFSVDVKLVDDPLFLKALAFSIAYSLVITDQRTFCGKLTTSSDLRISYVLSVYFWLPLRRGEPITLQSQQPSLRSPMDVSERLSRSESRSLLNAIQLQLFSAQDEKSLT